ncbi:hypothetical protein CDD82_6472 [Ophiocordyceps australis]|uniref:Choline kinase N-terminal domain-containing protein n=1 Tax=Ophiocordyceps australis TaxID=1399860 RepID=A0A2C5ZR22_9HYPO|nr:hypothetical protein CDD82_6472 [Ophiocordyceps australis]
MADASSGPLRSALKDDGADRPPSATPSSKGETISLVVSPVPTPCLMTAAQSALAPSRARLGHLTSGLDSLRLCDCEPGLVPRWLDMSPPYSWSDMALQDLSSHIAAVQIAEAARAPEPDDDGQSSRRGSRTVPCHRLSGRPAPVQVPGALPRAATDGSTTSRRSDDAAQSGYSSHHHAQKMFAQVEEWLARQQHKVAMRSRKAAQAMEVKAASVAANHEQGQTGGAHGRTGSVGSHSSDMSLDKLQTILHDARAHIGAGSRTGRSRRRPLMHRAASSDTDYSDGDAIVPSCDAWLDNSKTLSFPGGGSASTDNLLATASAGADKDREAWDGFKNEILCIAHTLRLKGWRRVPLGSGYAISVERLSGALTNAVYVMTPPADLPRVQGRNTPEKVLLRIYGPQVEHLIDRENELKVLKRLARKKIGPRLLGTFSNGRFEQFYKAVALKPDEMRLADISKQIAKRMRELHDGMDLLPQEREGGPAVWKNWDQWLVNVEKIVTFLDGQLEASSGVANKSTVNAWRNRGYVCGTPWKQFRAAVDKYRQYLSDGYHDARKSVRESLVFAHNDTQYGNILRMRIDDQKSPLVQAANSHKRLVVIDFEYAAANTPGFEVANHFNEWCYNYHDDAAPWACNTRLYPSPEQQWRFVKAYVDHRPQFASASSTPHLRPLESSGGGVSSSDFSLDLGAPAGGWTAADQEGERRSDQDARLLLQEAHLWRPTNSAMWVAWGIVQAKVPALNANNEPLPPDEARRAEDESATVAEFDYLLYAQDRAFFFWGDLVHLGLVKRDELPEALAERLKMVH